MRVIEVKSCRECPKCTRIIAGEWWCGVAKRTIPNDIKTFPKFCPLKEAKDG